MTTNIINLSEWKAIISNMRSQKGLFYLNVSICVDTKTWFECFIDATWHSVVKKYMRSDIIAWWHWWQSAFWTGSMSRTVRNEPVLGNESDFASLSVTYVSRVPWRREQRCHVPSPRLLYHRWAAELLARLLRENPVCVAPAAYLRSTVIRAAGCNHHMHWLV